MKKGSKEAKAWGRKMKALRNKPKSKKSTRKGGVRKTARRAYTKIKTRRKTNKAKKKSSGTLKLKSIASSGTLKKVALGVGGAAIATAVISAIAPNSTIGRYAAPAGAYVMGGIEGIIGSMALSMLSRPTGNANMSPAMEVL
jgi:hypothetical protein